MDASVNRIPSSKDERAFLVGICLRGADPAGVERSLEELVLLGKTAGAVIVDRMIVKRESLDAGFIVGKGIVERLRGIVAERNIRLLMFDLNNIRPAQVRNLEEALKCRVVGRTEVILDIFARRARSAESKIQVELAQLNYILPRLKGLGGVLSRLGGGIGTRGPGEKMLETDRRHILRRISVLREKLRKISDHRERIRRGRGHEVLGAVVGYTNAGKSTLLNVLARDDLFVEDRLFATLDAYTRIVYLDDNAKVLLTDTVGFIRNLPANLVESFKSTLEEIENARFLLHVIDGSAPDMDGAIRTVEQQLREMNCHTRPMISFLNKLDLLEPGDAEVVANRFPDSIPGSARDGAGIDLLKAKLMEMHAALRSGGSG